MIKIINKSDNPYSFRFYDSDGTLHQIDIGCKSDNAIVGRVQPIVEISNEAWGKIKKKAEPLCSNGLDDRPLVVSNA